MIMEGETSSERARLSGWKEIAAYLGRDQRTVRRWEQDRGLPIRRIPGDGQPTVFAYVDELSDWLDGRAPGAVAPEDAVVAGSARSRARPWLLAGFALAVVLSVAAGVIAISSRPPMRQSDPLAARSANAKATELYRSGLHEWQSRTPSGLERAVRDLKEAVAADPKFAAAYAELASAYDVQHEFSKDTPGSLYNLAIQAAGRAIALDPDLANAHAALGFAEFYGARRTADALREFQRAVTLDPKDALAHHWYATALLALGDFKQAETEIETARILDPESLAIPADKALILFHLGRGGEARTELLQLETDDPLFASTHLYLADIAQTRRDYGNYLRETLLFSNACRDPGGEAVARAGMAGLASGGPAGMFRAELAVQRKLFDAGRLSAFQLSRTYALLGDAQNAIHFLELSVARREPDNIAMKVDAVFDPLRTNARMMKLTAQAGLAAGEAKTKTM